MLQAASSSEIKRCSVTFCDLQDRKIYCMPYFPYVSAMAHQIQRVMDMALHKPIRNAIHGFAGQNSKTWSKASLAQLITP